MLSSQQLIANVVVTLVIAEQWLTKMAHCFLTFWIALLLDVLAFFLAVT